MAKRISVVRASDGLERESFIEGLLNAPSEVYVTESDGRPPTAILVGGAVVEHGVLAIYEVDDNVIWDEPIEGEDYSMFAFFRPKDGLEHDDFVKRYRQHADIARVHHPGIRRYVQDIITSQTGEERWMFAAISELHFAGPNEYRERFWLGEESRDVVARDVARFSDASSAKMVVAPRVT